MLAGIAGGFGQALADDQKEKKAWLRDQKMMNRKYAMTTGTAAIGAANDKRDAVLRKSAYLTDRGIDNNTLMYVALLVLIVFMMFYKTQTLKHLKNK